MIRTNDERIKKLLLGQNLEEGSSGDVAVLQDAVHLLNAASSLDDTLYVGLRTIRVITTRRRRYYVDTGGALWITFEWRLHDAINVRLVRLRRTTLGSAFRR